jgi:hypothetical protein
LKGTSKTKNPLFLPPKFISFFVFLGRKSGNYGDNNQITPTKEGQIGNAQRNQKVR